MKKAPAKAGAFLKGEGMENCIKCGRELPAGALWCCWCGKKQQAEKRRRIRGNGQGTVYRRSNGKYRAEVVLGYYTDAAGKKRRKTRSKDFAKKKDAVAALTALISGGRQKINDKITFHEVFEAWSPGHAEKVGASTMGNYKAAYKHLESLWFLRMADIEIDDILECFEECPAGKRTKQNMKALLSLLYKWALPRHCVPSGLNLSDFVTVSGKDGPPRPSFTAEQIKQIRGQIGKTPGAEAVYCMIYLGFRPSEFLTLTRADYDEKARAFVGGAKTAAGRGRTVTVSPKIQQYITAAYLAADAQDAAIFGRDDGTPYNLQFWTESVFYAVLEAAGIENPLVEIGGGVKRHLYTPHCCRHTFATLMKAVNAAAVDKQELIGHASEEQLKYYQSVALDDLRRITDAI